MKIELPTIVGNYLLLSKTVNFLLVGDEVVENKSTLNKNILKTAEIVVNKTTI